MPLDHQLPVDGVYLRFLAKANDRQAWVRRSLFSTQLAWTRCWLLELATAFETRDAATTFAREYHLLADVELVTVRAEQIQSATETPKEAAHA